MLSRRLWFASLLITAFSWNLWAGKQFQPGAGEETVSDQLIVRLQAGADIRAVLANLPPGVTEAIIHSQKNLHLLQLPPGLARQLATILANHPLVQYVESNHVRHATIGTPNDSSYSSQWALAAMNAVSAWSLLPGQYMTAASASGPRTPVAVLDTGIDCTHPDFQNAGATSGDAAHGGQISFALSRAFVPSTISSSVCSVMDDHGHGTHVAGTIAAATQNGLGVASVAWPVAVVSYKVLDKSGAGTDAMISQAIMAAADAGIPVVSLSLGGPGYSQSMQDAVTYAWQHNTLVVAAAGNSGSNVLTFPAGANYAMGVSATDVNNNVASFSNYGNSVDIAAPGVNILSTSPTYSTTLGLMNYGTLSGTSMATPHVAAVAGLIAMANPGATAAAIAQRLQQSAQSTIAGGGWNQSFGYGVVNALTAISGSLRPSSFGGITGQVVDATGLPVQGASVSVAGQSLFTAADGLFRFSNLSAGAYNLTASAAGYPSAAMEVTVLAGADTSVALPLISSGQFSGVVTDRGVAVSGVSVQALSGGAIVATAVTDASGSYTLTAASGSYSLKVSALGAIGSTTAPITLPSNATVPVNFNIARLGTIAGTVRDGSGRVIAGAAIAVSGGATTVGATTDAGGNYQTIGLPGGVYSVTASAAGLPTTTVTGVSVAPDTTAPANPVMGAIVFTPIRVDAGGAAYTDATGTVWSADSSFSGGATWAVSNPISNTAAQPLYQTCRYGNFSYGFAVPNGTYTVNLKFAEVSAGGPGQRLFNAAINGSSVLSNFDIYAQAGGMFIAVDRPFTVNVTGGQIVIQFTSGNVNLPMVNAIEVTQGAAPPPPPPPPPAPGVLINAGGAAYLDPSGQQWAADSYYSGGATWSVTNSIANTTAPALYQTCRYGEFAYTIPIANGTYAVTLKFAEPSASGPGQRVFNAAINGAAVLSNFDIFAQAGGMFIALDKTFTVNVTNGQMVVQFSSGPVNLPMVNAIQIAAAATAASVPSYHVNAGGVALTDGSGQSWSADSYFSGGATWSVGGGIANTPVPALYQTCRYGNFSYSFDAPAGNYTVTLKFAEITQVSAGSRVFNVAINGSTVLANFDIYAQAGGALIALDKVFTVASSGGKIAIQFTSGAANLPLVNAIQIVPAP